MNRTALLLAAMLCVIGCAKEVQPRSQLILDIGEPRFAEFPAEATLEAIGSISKAADSPVNVGMRTDNGIRDFVFSTSEIYYRHGLSIELSHFQLGFDRITHDDEEISLAEAKRRIKVYAEAARLTDSRPVFSIRATSGAKNSTLGLLLASLHAEGIVHLITEPAEPAVVANPHPLRVGTPYEIRPSDLFPTAAP